MHATGYVLDRVFQLVTGHSEELTAGLLEMIEKMLPKPEDQAKAMQQLQNCRSRTGLFGHSVAINSVSTTPAHSGGARTAAARPSCSGWLCACSCKSRRR
jgi:hypothetical protein